MPPVDLDQMMQDIADLTSLVALRYFLTNALVT